MHQIIIEDHTQIIRVKFSGEYGLQEIMAYHNDLLKIELPEKILILEDYRNAEPVLTSSDMDKIIQLSKETLKVNKIFRVAFLNDSPKSIALAQVFEEELNSYTFTHKAFSSEAAAMGWLTAWI